MKLTVFVLIIVLECNAFPSEITNKTNTQHKYVIIREHIKTGDVSHRKENRTIDLNTTKTIYKQNPQSKPCIFTLIPCTESLFPSGIIFHKPTSAPVKNICESPCDSNRQINSALTGVGNYSERKGIKESVVSHDNVSRQPMPLELNILKGDICPSGFVKIGDRCTKLDRDN